MRKNKRFGWIIAGLVGLGLLIAVPVLSTYYDGYFMNVLLRGGLDIQDQSSALGTPDSGVQRLYGVSTITYMKDSSGNARPVIGHKKFIQLALTGFWIDGGSELTGSSTPNLEEDDAVPALVWADGETTKVHVTFRVPADYISSGRFKLLATESDSTTPNEVDFEVYVNTDGSAADSSATNQTPVALAGTTSTSDEVTLTPATDFASLAAGDWVTLGIWRDDTATGTGDLEIKGVVFEYD